jgi:predicted RNase H-like HicB family nuclease
MMEFGLKPHVFTVLIEQDEDGYYVATVPALKCHQ